MIRGICIVFILFSSLAFSQKHNWENLPFEGELPVTNPIYEKLEILDTNALVLLLRNWRYRSLKEYKEYIVFHLDGSLEIRILNETINTSNKNEIKVLKIEDRQGFALWAFLDSCLEGNLFALDQEKLNIQSGPEQRSPYKTSKISVVGGANYSFAFFCGRKYLNYHTYAPEAYIKADFPGAAERVQFMLIYNSFEKIKEELINEQLPSKKE